MPDGSRFDSCNLKKQTQELGVGVGATSAYHVSLRDRGKEILDASKSRRDDWQVPELPSVLSSRSSLCSCSFGL